MSQNLQHADEEPKAEEVEVCVPAPQDKQDIKQSPEPALASKAVCCQTPHGAACHATCSLGSSHPIQGDTAWDAGKVWEPTQGGLWALQPFLLQGDGCPTVLVRSGQEKGGKVPGRAQTASPMPLEN
ncbi:uncharacterized protein ACIB01_011321 [Guaruba guarouba]